LEGGDFIEIEVKSSDLASVYAEMAEVVGVENTIKIFEAFRGQQITMPQKLYKTEYVRSYLKENYNGKNLKELSRLFDYSERHLRALLNG